MENRDLIDEFDDYCYKNGFDSPLRVMPVSDISTMVTFLFNKLDDHQNIIETLEARVKKLQKDI